MKVNLIVKNIDRGYANKKKGQYRVVIPKWAFNYGENYWVYYVCHELAHISHQSLYGAFGHTTEFKVIEDMYLADFGLYIIRKKVYPKAILELEK
jgi:hypothetical protein